MNSSQSAASLRQAKSEARARFRRELAGVDARPEREARLHRHLQSALENARGVWAAYRGMPEEADVFAGLPRRAGLDWAFPVVVGAELQFRRPTDRARGESFAPSAWGILEPQVGASTPVEAEGLAGFLVPALAFDREGRRLGRGKGFYDKCLEKSNGLRLGIAFAAQVSATPLPVEEHDARMDAVVTEDGIIWTSERRP